MEEILDMVRTEPVPASAYFDDVVGGYITVDEELRDKMFARFQTLHSTVRAQQYEVRARYLIVGACLAEIQRDKLYGVVKMECGVLGYGSFYDFCAAVFGFKKSTVVDLISVYHTFCNEEGLLHVEYTNFSYSQLVELTHVPKYRERIPVTCSVRNIRKLKELYREYVPRGGTYEDDLKEWQRRHEQKLMEENADKNKIVFVPSKKPNEAAETSAKMMSEASDRTSGHSKDDKNEPDPGKNPTDRTSGQSENGSESWNFSEDRASGQDEPDTDEREISTPNVTRGVSFEQIRDGLLRQLDLLRDVIGWRSASDVFIGALENNRPISIARTVDVLRVMQEKDELVRENTLLKERAGQRGAAAGGEKLELKNKAAREAWLNDFRSWGVWLEVPELSVKYYRYEFRNGAAITVTVGLEYWDAWSTRKGIAHERIVYTIQDDQHEKFAIDGVSKTYVLDWLSTHAKEL